LCELGHQKIAFILGKTDGRTSWTSRLEGYKMALEHNGIEYVEDLVIRTGTRYGAGYHSMKSLLEKTPRPTAIFAGSDIMAIGGCKSL
jgi:LacI family transcriptional regulator